MLAVACIAHGIAPAAQSWLAVSSVDLARLAPASFAENELDLPYYLAHFHRLAESVRATEPHRGFIGLSVWRDPKDNQPHNARIMENIVSLAYFYTADRPWNRYRGDPAVRQRLEAALDFWCRIQNADGRFSEYAPERWNLAATAFATKFVGHALLLLDSGPAIDPAIHKRAIDALRKAVRIVLTDPSLYEQGRRFSNQFTNVWSGAFALLRIRPDSEIQSLLERRIRQAHADFQSPAGYFYEAGGPDWGYNLGTHHHNLQGAWHYARDTPLASLFVEEERRWADWLALNALPEPDWSGFVFNRAIETRQRHPFMERANTPLAEHVPLARAFATSVTELRAAQTRERREIEARWPQVRPLAIGEFSAFSPYVFLQRAYVQWHPTEDERQAARASLPTARDRFTHQRMDTSRLVFTFVRRPGYFAAFNSGKRLTEQQRYGLGLLWTPRGGSMLQSQTASSDAAWGTLPTGRDQVYEAGDLEASFHANDRQVQPEVGARDLTVGDLTVSYRLGQDGSKTIAFREHEIAVDVRHRGPFVESIPLLAGPGDTLRRDGRGLRLIRHGLPVRLEVGRGASSRIVKSASTVGRLGVRVVHLAAAEHLTYRFVFTAAR